MVALAGCGGGTGPADGGDTETDTPTPGEGTPTETSTPTATPTSTPTATPSPSADAAGAALSTHQDELADRDGVVVTVDQWTKTDIQNMTNTGTLSIDLDTGEAYANVTVATADDQFLLKQYSPPGVDRIQSCSYISGECVSLSNSTQDPRRTAIDPVTQQGEIAGLPGFEDRGVVATEQGQLRKFVADGTGALSDDVTSADFESFHMALFFDPQTGLLEKFVYEATYTADGTTLETSMTYTYDYRSVDISTPDWYVEKE